MNAIKIIRPALSVRQPYAWLIVRGLKPIENRTWSTTYRGPLIIHASSKMHEHGIEEIERRYGVKIDRNHMHLGGIVGRVDLVDVVTAHSSAWFHGPFGWVCESPAPLPFRAASGKQGLFEID